MAKIELDKYYTPDSVALYCIEKAYEVIGRENITDVVEPSAGAGAFSRQIPGCKAFDLVPECEGVEQQDFLKLWLPYQVGRLIIGNPPFGGGADQILYSFFNQACGMGDYIAWVLPIGHHNNTAMLWNFDLIHSEDLGDHLSYSGVRLHCCFNIYRRPVGLMENKPKKEKLQDVTLIDFRGNDGNRKGLVEVVSLEEKEKGWRERYPDDEEFIQFLKKSNRMKATEFDKKTKYSMFDFDLVISSWGTLGKPCDTLYDFSGVMGIKVHRPDLKEDILDAIYEAEHRWERLYPSISTPSLSVWKVARYLKSLFPELK